MELQNFYRLIKFKAYFKDIENQPSNDEKELFKAKSKQNWTPDKTHHLTETRKTLMTRKTNHENDQGKI